MKIHVRGIIVLTLTLLLVLFIGSTKSLASDGTSASDEITNITIPQYKQNIRGIKSISGKTLLKKIKSQNNFVLFIGFKECPYCRKFSPVLHEYLTYRHQIGTRKSTKPIYYLDIDSYKNKDTKKSALEYIKILKVTKLKTTPTIDQFVHGKIRVKIANSNTTFQELKDSLK